MSFLLTPGTLAGNLMLLHLCGWYGYCGFHVSLMFYIHVQGTSVKIWLWTRFLSSPPPTSRLPLAGQLMATETPISHTTPAPSHKLSPVPGGGWTWRTCTQWMPSYWPTETMTRAHWLVLRSGSESHWGWMMAEPWGTPWSNTLVSQENHSGASLCASLHSDMKVCNHLRRSAGTDTIHPMWVNAGALCHRAVGWSQQSPESLWSGSVSYDWRYHFSSYLYRS